MIKISSSQAWPDQLYKLNFNLWHMVMDASYWAWFPVPGPMSQYCDNKAAINIVHNHVQHDRTKHIEVDCHFIKDHLKARTNCISFIKTKDHNANVFIKGLHNAQFSSIIWQVGSVKSLFSSLRGV